jgi:hypothetical protein
MGDCGICMPRSDIVGINHVRLSGKYTFYPIDDKIYHFFSVFQRALPLCYWRWMG